MISESVVDTVIKGINTSCGELSDGTEFKRVYDDILEAINKLKEAWTSDSGKEQCNALQNELNNLSLVKIQVYLDNIKHASVTKSTYMKKI